MPGGSSRRPAAGDGSAGFDGGLNSVSGSGIQVAADGPGVVAGLVGRRRAKEHARDPGLLGRPGQHDAGERVAKPLGDGPQGIDETKVSYWRVRQGFAWFFDLGDRDPDFSAGNMAVFTRNPDGAWRRKP